MKIILEKANRGIALQQSGGIPSDVVTFMLANYIKLNWRGAWSSESTYNYNDAVSYLGSSYVALRATTEQPGETAVDWNLLAKKGTNGNTPYIGENGNWWVSGEDTGTKAAGNDGVGILNWELVSTVGKVKTYRITFSNLTTFEYTLEDGADGRGVVSFELIDVQEKTKTYRMLFTDTTFVDIYIIDGQDGKSAYQSALDGGYTGTESEFNALFNSIDEHISDDSIHHTFDQIRDDLGINEETGSESKYLNEKGDMTEIVIGSGGYSAHVYATTINSDITGYKKSSYTAETSETVISTTLSNSTVLVEEYIFDAPLGITQMPNGSWLFHYYAKIGSTNPQGAKLRFAVYTRGTTGDETLLFTKDTPTFTNTDYVQVLPLEFIGNLYTCLATDRIVFKVYVVTTSVPNVTVSYIVGDGRGLYVDSPIQLRHSQTREKNEELAYQHVDSTAELGEAINETTHSLLLWNGLKALKVTFARMKTWLSSLYLKLDQTTPQTLTSSPKITSLTATKIPYANADKQLVDSGIVWDAVKLQIQLDGISSISSGYGIVSNKNAYFGGVIVFSAATGSGNLGGSSFNIGRDAVYPITNVNTGNNSAMSFGTKNIEAVRIDPNQNVGIKTIAPKSALQVVGGIQCGDDTSAASADKVGTRRNRTGAVGNVGFYVSEECAITGVGTYAWVTVFRNEWIIP